MQQRRKSLIVAAGLVLFVVLAWGTFLSKSDWNGTEARRAVIAREMFRTSDYVVPRHGGELTLAKPPLHYQLQAFSMTVFGERLFAARFPSLLLMALLVAVVYLASLSFGRNPKPRYALAAALVFATSPVLFQFGISAEIDGSFAVWIAFSLFALCQACVSARPTPWFLLSGLCAGLGLLTKGPPLLLFLVPAWLPLLRNGAFKALLLWIVPAVVPGTIWWLLLRGTGVLSSSAHAAVAQSESLGRIGFYNWGDVAEIPGDMAKVLVLLLPVTLLLPYAWKSWKSSTSVLDEKVLLAHRVLLCSSLCSLVAFWFFPHRATRYLLPAFPPLLFLLVHRSTSFLEAPPKSLMRATSCLCLLLTFALLPFLFYAPPWLHVAAPAVLLLAVVAPRSSFLAFLLAAGCAAQLVLGLDVAERNSLPPRQPSPVAEILKRHCGNEKILAWGHVPSELIWLLQEQLGMDEAMNGDLSERKENWLLWEALPQRGDDFVPVEVQIRARISIREKDLVLASRRR